VSDTYRILVTGSRGWADVGAVWRALHDVIRAIGDATPVIVHGHCGRGADQHADEYARTYGIDCERHPADWRSCGSLCPPRPHRKTRADRGGDYCPLAGHARNQHMVDLGADVLLAFVLDDSKGANDCARRALNASIPTIRYERSSDG
jgi:hypothetical protein